MDSKATRTSETIRAPVRTRQSRGKPRGKPRGTPAGSNPQRDFRAGLPRRK